TLSYTTLFRSPDPNLGNDTAICAGDEIYLKNLPKTGYDFLWSTTETSDSIAVNAAGTFTLTKTNQTTGCFASDDKTITINPLPTVDLGIDIRQCEGTSVTFAAGGPAANYDYL